MQKPTPMPATALGNAFRKPDLSLQEMVLVAIYLRVSSDGQIEKYGLPVQRKICLEYITRFPNWKLFGVYIDEGVSGTTTEREDLDRLQRDAQAHGVHFVVVAYLSRQAREEYAGYFLDREFQAIGIELVSATQDPDPYNINRIGRKIQRLMDSEDRERILAQTNDGRQEAAEAGYWTGGTPPFGYKTVTVDKKHILVIDETEATVLLRMVELVVDHGYNVAETARQLNAEGLLTKQGLSWTDANVHSRLRSEATAGYSTFRKVTTKGKHATKVAPDGAPLLGTSVVRKLPTIVTPERHAALMIALARNGRPRDLERHYLLSGLIKGRCGAHYVGGSGNIRRYVCTGKRNPKATGCTDIVLQADEIEDAVWTRLSHFLTDREKLAALAEEWLAELPNDRAVHQVNMEALTVEVERQRGALEKLVLDLAVPGLDPDEKELLNAAKHTQMQLWKAAKKELAQVTALLETYDTTHTDVTRMAALVADVEFRLDTMTSQERTVLLRLLDVRVAVEGELRAAAATPSPLDEWHRATDTLVPADPDDTTWPLVESLLRAHNRGLDARAVPSERVRLALRAILHRLRSGCRWRALPEEFVPGAYGHWSSISTVQYQWWHNGTWTALMELLADLPGAEPIATAHARPPLVVTGRFNRDLLELDSLTSASAVQASRSLSEQSKIFSFILQVA